MNRARLAVAIASIGHLLIEVGEAIVEGDERDPANETPAPAPSRPRAKPLKKSPEITDIHRAQARRALARLGIET